MISFLLGLCASLLATAISYGIAVFISRQRSRYLEGYWFQSIPGLRESPYSIGKFTYNKANLKINWDGKNYNVMGEPVAEWNSFHLHLDYKERRILYIFSATPKDSHSSFSGFGVMNLRNKDGKGLIPIKGRFQDAWEGASPQNFTMTRLEDLAGKLGLDQGRCSTEDYHKEILRRYHLQNKDTQSDA